MEDITRTEKIKQSMSFIDQLQQQIAICRDAISAGNPKLHKKVLALECFLWPRLKNDHDYLDVKVKQEEILQNNKNIYAMDYNKLRYKVHLELFKQMMCFVEKQGYIRMEKQQ